MTIHHSQLNHSLLAGTAGPDLFLHASSVIIDGRAVLFLGHSTAGKSTIARLLAAQARVLADDSVFAFRDPSGRWCVVDGGFRFGAGDLSDWKNRIRTQVEGGSGVPLAACLRIHKADELRLEPMPALETARCLMDAAMEIDLQRKSGRPSAGAETGGRGVAHVRELRRRWFGLVADIARNFPGAELWFSSGSDAAALCELLRNQMGENREKFT